MKQASEELHLILHQSGGASLSTSSRLLKNYS